MIAELSAFAGHSPNCEAVLVQIEHCAIAVCVDSKTTKQIPKKIPSKYFIQPYFLAKISG
jgi:ribosomal protein S25